MSQTGAGVEAEVQAALSLLVHLVAYRHVAKQCEGLIAELEDYQEQCWTRDEWLYQQMRQKAMSIGSSKPAAERVLDVTPARAQRWSRKHKEPPAAGLTAGAVVPVVSSTARVSSRHSIPSLPHSRSPSVSLFPVEDIHAGFRLPSFNSGC
eukprot:scaffold272609_cov40-Tisochrysis_lutea.AAC.2